MYFKNDRYIFRKVRFDKGEPCKCSAQEVEKGGYFLGSRRGFILTEANNTKNFFNEGKEAFYILIRNDKLQIELALIFLHFCLWPLVTRCQGVEVKGSIRKKSMCVVGGEEKEKQQWRWDQEASTRESFVRSWSQTANSGFCATSRVREVFCI